MNDKLTNILQEWAAKKMVPQEHLNKLASHIGLELSRVKYKSPVMVEIPFWVKLSYAGLGAAVGMLVCMFFISTLIIKQPSTCDAKLPSKMALITDNQVGAGRQLFGEMDQLFADRLRWVVQSGGDIGLGVESINGGVDKDAKPMIVRFVVVSKKHGETGWNPVWDLDILLRGEEVVEVMPNHNVDNKIALWVYPLNDGRIIVDTSLSLDLLVRLSSRADIVAREGEPNEIASLCDDKIEYRVFQTVRLLDNKCGT